MYWECYFLKNLVLHELASAKHVVLGILVYGSFAERPKIYTVMQILNIVGDNTKLSFLKEAGIACLLRRIHYHPTTQFNTCFIVR